MGKGVSVKDALFLIYAPACCYCSKLAVRYAILALGDRMISTQETKSKEAGAEGGACVLPLRRGEGGLCMPGGM